MSQLPLWEFISPRISPRALSKSRVMAGLQCRKRLYLEAYHHDEKDAIDPGRLAILEAGRQVGEVARGRYPGGITVAEDPRLHDQAVDQTTIALAESGPPAIYEAAFTHAQIRTRVDILARKSGNVWDLIEVKSSSGFKEEYLLDIAIQLHVAEKCGVSVGRAVLLHVNNQYVWPGGPYDLEALFTELDLTTDARAAIPGLLECVDAMRATLEATEIPDIAVGPHCRKPYVCSFYDYCHEGIPEHHVTELPRLSPKMYWTLLGADICNIRDIPEEFGGLSELQWRVRNCVVTGEPYAHPDLKSALDAVRYPIHFLDFETCNPAIPIIPGTRPFQATPFQWSDHVLEADGTVHHRSYLHPDRTDPLLRLTEGLIAALDGEGSIVVYSEFEARVIRGLAAALPALACRLMPLVERRMVDLHRLIHSHYYHPEFRGSFSIKDVLPVLVAGLDYSDLEIREGSQAAVAFAKMTDPKTPAPERRRLRDGLLAYCRRDTEGMLRLYQTLKEIS
jgi:uncharacterized protein DUF2779